MRGLVSRFKAPDLYQSAATPAVPSADIATEFFFKEYTLVPLPAVVEILSPGLLTNTNTFYAPTITTGAVAVVASSAGVSNTGGAQIVFTKPSGLAVGDLMTAEMLVAGSASMTPSMPSGWAIPSGATTTFSGTYLFQRYVAYKVADSGDVAASTFTFDISAGPSPYLAYGVIKRITGAGASPINGTPTNQKITSGTTSTFPSVTTTLPDCLILISGGGTQDAPPSGSQWPNVFPSGTTGSTTVMDTLDNGYFGTAYYTQASAGATGTKTVACRNLTGVGEQHNITLAIAPAVYNQTLTPSLFTNTPTFYAPTVTRGSVTLTPSLFTNSSTFYGPTINRGAVTLSPPLFTNSSTFYSPTINRGAVSLLPSLFTNSSTFYAATISQAGGPQTLTPARFDNSSTFYAAALSLGAVTLTPARLDNASTFYGAAVVPGAVTITPGLFTNASTFYGPTIIQAAGNQTLTPSLFTNTSLFYGATILQPSLQTLLPGLFTNASIFFLPTVANDVPGGTYPEAIEGGGSVVLGSLRGGGSVSAGSISSGGRVIAGYLRGRP